MNSIVVGRVINKNVLVGIRVFIPDNCSFQWISKENFYLHFTNFNVLNCNYKGGSLHSKYSWFKLKDLTTFTQFGSVICEGLYTDTKIIAMFTNSNLNNIVVRICGAIMGAITNEHSIQAENHAILYYREVREMSTDIQKIAQNTNFLLDDIAKIKNYVFMQYHNLSSGYKRFDPCFTMALSWQRLMQGDFKPHDITLLKHELMELTLVEQGMKQEEAHELAEQQYNYNKEVLDYHDKTGKY